MVDIEKVCPICGDKFLAHNAKTMYCSEQCRKKGYEEKHKECSRAYSRRKSQEKRGTTPVKLHCIQCGRVFYAPNRKYSLCSEECKLERARALSRAQAKKQKEKYKDKQIKEEAKKEKKQLIIVAAVDAKAAGLSYGAYTSREYKPKWDKLNHCFY